MKQTVVFESILFELGDIKLHAKCAGDPAAPVMLFLHGFPEYWAAWEPVAQKFTEDYLVVLPDQRGFNLSSKPTAVEDYDTKHLVADMLALINEISPERPIILCGHDWGAAVAYAFAMHHPERIEKLVIVNGVHPITFQRALLAGGQQTKASQYMNRLREPGMDKILSANNYSKLLAMLQNPPLHDWLSDELRQGYVDAWSQPGALEAMLNWYCGSPMIVPGMNDAPVAMKLTESMLERYHISMPHLLIWGMKDIALLPEAREGLEQFCADLSIVEIDDGDHWVIHSHPDKVAAEIRQFMGK